MSKDKVTVIDLTIPSDPELTDEEDLYSDDDSIVVDEEEEEYLLGEPKLILEFHDCTFNFE